MLIKSFVVRSSLFSLVTLALAVPCSADTIHLKNGHTIVAEHVREKNNRVEYDIGDDTYAIRKDFVDRVDSVGTVLVRELALEAVPQPTERLSGSEQSSSQIIRNASIDTEAIKQAESSGEPLRAAAANFTAADFEAKRAKFEEARRYIERALTFMPQEPLLLEHLAGVLLRLGRPKSALYPAERAVELAPSSPEAQAILAYAYFQLNRTKDAIRCWQRSLELRPDHGIRELLAKAQRENTAESDFRDQASNHFLLKYEGEQTAEKLRGEILATLERHFDDLVRDLNYIPREKIYVSLYTQEAFFDVTQAPSWSAAVNDGKLRIPVEGLEGVTPELSRILKHELTHSFINQITYGRAPGWLHEGVAQIMEPKDISAYSQRLGQYYEAQANIPLNVLEGPFTRFNTQQAILAYLESLAAVEYIRDTYGMSDVTRILKRLGEGETTEAALRSTIHSGYSQFEREIGIYLNRK